MKKYFTKYLPVEGEIKPDDKILYQNKIATQGAVAYIIYYEDLKNVLLDTQIQLDSRRRVKLHLCTRDIKPIDVIKGNVHVFFKEEEGVDTRPFKVIGQISSEATWVKEGDEFDEEEVSIFDILGKISVLGIRLKGPCGHFH